MPSTHLSLHYHIVFGTKNHELITAIGQRFRFKSVRVVFMILASLLLCLPLWQLLVLPRI